MARIGEQLVANCWLPVLGIWALACSVDDRELYLGSGADTTSAGAGSGDGQSLVTGQHPGSSGGAADGGETQGPGGSGGNPTGGSSTGAGAGSPTPPLPPLVNGCADLDTDMVADCTVTLAKNPTFKRDVSDWTALPSAGLTWDPRNALGDTPSGCGLVTGTGSVTDIDGGVPFKVSQCVTVPANEIVIAYANGLIASTVATAEKPHVQLEVSFFDSEDCKGAATSQFFTPPSDSTSWVTIQAGGLSGPATTSASIALVAIKPYRAAELSACFDNVMVKAKPPSP